MESEKKTLDQEQLEIAKAYAKYLKDHNLKPGDATFVEPENLGIESELLQQKIEEPDIEFYKDNTKNFEENNSEESETIRGNKAETKQKKFAAFEAKRAAAKEKQAKRREDRINKEIEKAERRAASRKKSVLEELETATAAPIFVIDKFADAYSDWLHRTGANIATATDKMVSAYTNSKRGIATAALSVCILSALMLVVFDRFTVFEYSYNGMVLGYVDAQEDVTNVLSVAGDQLNEVNTESDQEIEFVANDNISFKRVVKSGKDTDDADTTVNKLAYMTDIEVEASGIYDGDTLVTIVENEDTAETLLAEVKKILGTPDEGMTVEYADFLNPLEIKPINILLTSVQSDTSAVKQMTEGGNVKFYHLVEEGETISSIAATFGVEAEDLYNENNEEQITSVSRGEKICIRKTVSPVSVELVESGKMKEIVPYETIKKDSKKYYIGDEVVDTKGVDGIQIFSGTVTKVGGKVTDRDTDSLEVLREKVDEVILVGITEKPKTAPTGTFLNPMVPGTYIVTSRPGWRWGRTHEGVDMGASTGTAVYASDGGTVVRAGVYGGYGNCIDIQHEDGWISRYGHLSAYGVKVGDKVYQGQYIGAVGNTGRSTGPHLHFEIRHDGVFVDPDTMVEGGL